MSIKSVCWVCGLAALLFAGHVRAEVIGHWTLDETSGTVATDSSGKEHHGTYVNSPGLDVPGALDTGTAMNTATGHMRVNLGGDLPIGADERTIALWLNPVSNNIDRKFVAYGDTAAGGAFTFTVEPVNGQMGVRFRHWGGNFTYPGVTVQEWQHIAIIVPPGSTMTSDVQVYINGVNSPGAMTGTPDRNLVTGTSDFFVGTVHNTTGHIFDGVIDDVWLFDHALTEQELAKIMAGGSPELAAGPVPADGASDVPYDTDLGWTAGKFAAAHDVYFGDTFDAVNTADRANPMDVLSGPAQTDTTFSPGDLEFGRTYYWRVDEVNAAPDSTVFKGEVWSFTVEPFAYAIQSVSATASSAQEGMEPGNTVDSSGLDSDDLHATLPTTMWLSDGTLPNWIQYEFDEACKLHEMWVWNSNQMTEAFIGFGAKDVAIEYSLDGATWTQIADVPEFAKAPGKAAYAHDTTVDLGGVQAKFVRLTINSSWGGLPQAGLSEVRFFSVPVQARAPQPAAGATTVSLDAELNWRPGREAISHEVFFDTDANAVADGTVAGQTVTEHSYTPASMSFGTKYFWKVNEIGDTGAYAGDLWSFTTLEYAVVDDMEGYNDDDNRIYQAWVDGVTTGASGSTVGYFQAPFAEKTIVHDGKQSMPFEYNNVNTPFFSEAEQEFSTAQDWTVNGADTLSLWVRGVPVAYVEEAGTVTLSAAGSDIWNTADNFRYAFKTLNGDGSIVVKVESLANTNAWAKAGVMIRQSLDADSSFVYFIQSYSSGLSFGWRPTPAASAASVPATTGIVAPQWLKLTRKGDVFTAQYSADGTTWTDLKVPADGTVASTTVAMTGPVYVGLCLTSHNVNAATTAVMSGVTTTGNVTGGSWQVQAIGTDPQPANAPADFYVTVQDSAGKKATATNATAATTAAWTQWKIPLSSLTAVNLKAVKKLIVGVDSRTSPTKGGGMIYIDDIGFGHAAQ